MNYYNKFLKYKLKNQHGGLTPEQLARKQELIAKYEHKETLCISQHFKQHERECWNDAIQYAFAFTDGCKELVQKKLLNLSAEEILELAELNERDHLIPYAFRGLDEKIDEFKKEKIIKYLNNFKFRLLAYIRAEGIDVTKYTNLPPLARINTKNVSLNACMIGLDLLEIDALYIKTNNDIIIINLLSYLFLDDNETYEFCNINEPKFNDKIIDDTDFCIISFGNNLFNHITSLLKCENKYIYYDNEQSNTDFNWKDYLIKLHAGNDPIISKNISTNKSVLDIRESTAPENIIYTEYEIIKFNCFIKKSMDKEYYNKLFNPFNNTPLMHMAEIRNFNNIKLLIERGANVNEKNTTNNTPLMIALKSFCDYKIIKLLIENGANVNEKNFINETPLMIVLKNYFNYEIIKLLIENGADVKYINNNKESVLMVALKYTKDFNIIDLILTKNRDTLNYINKYDDTPLLYAFEYDHPIDNIIKLIPIKIKNYKNILNYVFANKDYYNNFKLMQRLKFAGCIFPKDEIELKIYTDNNLCMLSKDNMNIIKDKTIKKIFEKPLM